MKLPLRGSEIRLRRVKVGRKAAFDLKRFPAGERKKRVRTFRKVCRKSFRVSAGEVFYIIAKRYLNLSRRDKFHCAKRNFTFHSANGRISLRAAHTFSIGETGRKYAREMAGGEGFLEVGISTKSGKRLDME